MLAAVTLLAPLDASAQRRHRRHHPTPGGGAQPAETAPDEPETATPAAQPAATPPTPAAQPAAAPPAPAQPAAATAPVQQVPPPHRAPPPVREERPASPAAHPAAFDIQIGAALFGRHLFFTDDLFGQLRPYGLGPAPLLIGSLEWYPAAHFTSGPASWFGLVGGGEYALGISSRDAQDRSYATTAYAFHAGVRGRYVIGPVDAGLVVGYGQQGFNIEGTRMSGTEGIPNVTYQYIRTALNARVQLVERVALTANAGYLFVLASGDIGSAMYFPRELTGGYEFGLGGALALGGGLEVRLNVDWRRFYYSMNSRPGDNFVAGGAADDFFYATASIAFRR